MDIEKEQSIIEEAEKDVERYVEADYDSKITVKRGRLIRKLKQLKKTLVKKENRTEEEDKLLEKIDSLLDSTLFKHKIQLKERYNHEFLEGAAKVPDVFTTLPKGIALQTRRVVNCIDEIKNAEGVKAKLVGFGNFAKNTGLLVATPVIFAGKFVAEHWYLILFLLKYLAKMVPNFPLFNKWFKKGNGDNENKNDNNKPEKRYEDVKEKEPGKLPKPGKLPIIPPIPIPKGDEEGKETSPEPVPEPVAVPAPQPVPVGVAADDVSKRITRKQLDALTLADKLAKGKEPVPVVPPTFSQDDKVDGNYVYPELNPRVANVSEGASVFDAQQGRENAIQKAMENNGVPNTSKTPVPIGPIPGPGPEVTPSPGLQPEYSFYNAFNCEGEPDLLTFARTLGDATDTTIYPTVEDAINACYDSHQLERFRGNMDWFVDNIFIPTAQRENIAWVTGQGGLFGTEAEFRDAMSQPYDTYSEFLDNNPVVQKELAKLKETRKFSVSDLLNSSKSISELTKEGAEIGAGALIAYFLVKYAPVLVMSAA